MPRDRPDYRRAAIAVEAARIIQEEGLADFGGAKLKAAGRLGYGRGVPLPTNAEIEAALAERARIFHGDTQPGLVEAMRHAALEVMRELSAFHPRLVGDVLSGTATVHSRVELHLFSDTIELVGDSLESLGMGYRMAAQRLRPRQDELESYPSYRFSAHDCDFNATVFPLKLRGHAPLSKVDGKPMRRAGMKELRELLARP